MPAIPVSAVLWHHSRHKVQDKPTLTTMSMTAAQMRRIARPLLGLLLFAQGVVAAQTCVAREASPIQAFAAAPAMAAMAMDDDEQMPCHEQAGDNKNACFVHCTQADQVSTAQAAMPFVAASTPVLVLDTPAVPAIIRPPQQLARVATDSGPPISIRFCSFLI